MGTKIDVRPLGIGMVRFESLRWAWYSAGDVGRMFGMEPWMVLYKYGHLSKDAPYMTYTTGEELTEVDLGSLMRLAKQSPEEIFLPEFTQSTMRLRSNRAPWL